MNLKKMLTNRMTAGRRNKIKRKLSNSKPKQMKKTIYAASETITTEKLNEMKGQVTESQVLTSVYLRKLHTAPDSQPFEQFGLRYRR